MDRLTLTLFGLDHEQEAAIMFEANVNEISLPFLNLDETFLAMIEQFCPAIFCYRRYHRNEC